MRKISGLLWMFASIVLLEMPFALQAQGSGAQCSMVPGEPVIYSNCSTVNTASAAYIDASVFTGLATPAGDVCATIQYVLTNSSISHFLPGSVVDARGILAGGPG